MAILFLFAAQCFRELRAINRRRRLLHSLPWLPNGREPADMVYEAEIGMGHFVERKLIFCCINRMTSVAVYGLILIPKFLIACGLAGLGCCWLASSASFGDLILNSLALVFVTDIDEILFNVFLPPRLEDNLSKLKIAWHRMKSSRKKSVTLKMFMMHIAGQHGSWLGRFCLFSHSCYSSR